ncbi:MULTISPECIES: NUDIX hydrolase [Bacillus]|uniref:NUDIX hydrolase n=1 Tax=Bacillus TaxID=1386 RepID=UPI000BB67882|nr:MULTISPECIES: NUDIX domain-containing protein [Bacillus]
MFIVNVEGAIYKENKWLLIRRSEKEEHEGGQLSLVGGKVEQEGHTTDIFERTVKREIWEEVGIEVDNLQYVNSSTFVTDVGEHVVDIVLLCQHVAGVAYAKSPDEVDEVLWLTTEEIMNNPSLPPYLKHNVKLADKILKETVC